MKSFWNVTWYARGAEMPLLALDERLWLERPAARKALARLVAKGSCFCRRPMASSTSAARKSFPSGDLDLRGAGQSFGIEDGNGAIIGMIDGLRAFRENHEGAVYPHRGRSYVVEELDPRAAEFSRQAGQNIIFHPREKPEING